MHDATKLFWSVRLGESKFARLGLVRAKPIDQRLATIHVDANLRLARADGASFRG